MEKNMKLMRIMLFAAMVPSLAVSMVFANGVPEASSKADENIATKVDWYYTAFGQSVDLRFHNSANIPAQDGINNVWINPSWGNDAILTDAAQIKPNDNKALFTQSSTFIPPLDGALEHDVPVKLNAGDTIILESRGGKITTGHDGLTFFYTKLPTDRLFKMTADVTKSSIGSHPDAGSAAISNQTGAGLMARDVVGGNRQVPYLDGFEEVPACSNFVGAGLWSNGNNSRPGSAYRIGVTSPFHAVGNKTNRGTAGDFPTNPVSNTEIGLTFTYTLERANEGFYYEVTAKDGSSVVPRSKISDTTPDMLQTIDGENMYWGFAASREIRIIVENVVLQDVGAASFTPTPPAVTVLNPNAEVVMRSRNATTRDAAVLALRPNHDGTMLVSNSATNEVVFDSAVSAYNEAYIDVELAMGENIFTYEFVTQNPDVNVKETNGTVSVTRNAVLASTNWSEIWAAPAAKGSGSGENRANAMAISHATAIVEPGQTIYLVNERYEEISIGNNNSGSPDKYVRIMSEPGVNQVRALNVIASDGSSYMYFKGILAGGSSDNDRFDGDGIVMGHSDFMIVENCTAQWTTGTGFTLNSKTGGNKGTWAKYNTFLNCTAFHNEDAARQDSDGYKMQGFGVGNKYIGCTASFAGDDGWDHFLRVGDGPGGNIYYENCIAFNNNANGFKLGGEGQPTPMELVNCLAYDNGMAGYSDNFNPGNVKLVNCIGIDNSTQNFIMRDNPIVEPAQELIDSISFRTKKPVNFFIDAVAGTAKNSALILDKDSIVSYLNDEPVTAEMFASFDRTKAFTRDADGNLIRGDFARLLP
jgi:hypothetical protein